MVNGGKEKRRGVSTAPFHEVRNWEETSFEVLVGLD